MIKLELQQMRWNYINANEVCEANVVSSVLSVDAQHSVVFVLQVVCQH